MKRESDGGKAASAAVLDRFLPFFALALPLGALVQVKLPIGAAGIAITLSDIVVAAGLFALALRWQGRLSLKVNCLVPHLAWWFGLATAGLAVGLVVGFSRIGLQTWAAVRLAGWAVLLAHVVVTAWIASNPHTRRLAIQVFTIGAAASIALDASIILFKSVFVVSGKCAWVEPARGLTPNPNAYAFMLLMAFAVTAREMQRGLFGAPVMNVVLVAALAFALALTSSRSAWLAALVVVALVLIAGWTRRLPLTGGIAIGGALAAILIVILVCSASTAVTDDVRALGKIVTEPSSMDAPMQERLYSHRRAIEMFFEHPLLGVGLGAFLASELGRGSWALIIHSTPLWLLAETGLVGAGSFAALAVALLIALITAIRRGTAEHKGDAITALLIVCAFGVMSLAQELLYQRSLWIMLSLFIFSPASGTPLARWSHGDSGAALATERQPSLS